MTTPPDRERQAISWATSGPIYADQIERNRHDGTVQLALEAIAYAQGDVGGGRGRMISAPDRRATLLLIDEARTVGARLSAVSAELGLEPRALSSGGPGRTGRFGKTPA